MLVIDPDECIDCTLCVAECPVEAIFAEDDVPADQKDFTALNAELSKVWKPLVERKPAPARRRRVEGREGKAPPGREVARSFPRSFTGRAVSMMLRTQRTSAAVRAAPQAGGSAWQSRTATSPRCSRVLSADAGATPEQLRVAQALIEVLPIPVFFKGRDGRYLGVNKAWEEFFGVARSAIIGARRARPLPPGPLDRRAPRRDGRGPVVASPGTPVLRDPADHARRRRSATPCTTRRPSRAPTARWRA